MECLYELSDIYLAHYGSYYETYVGAQRYTILLNQVMRFAGAKLAVGGKFYELIGFTDQILFYKACGNTSSLDKLFKERN